jgi:hypothetical protein
MLHQNKLERWQLINFSGYFNNLDLEGLQPFTQTLYKHENLLRKNTLANFDLTFLSFPQKLNKPEDLVRDKHSSLFYSVKGAYKGLILLSTSADSI